MAAFLQHIGGGEIDREAPGRNGESDGGQGRPHPLARFADRLVRQPDDGKGRHAGRDLHLHVDRQDVDP